MAMVHGIALFVHLACMLSYGGSTVGSLLIDRALWDAIEGGRDREALSFGRLAMSLGRVAQITAVLTLLSGVGMLASTSFAQWGQLWLYGKLALFLALTGVGGAVGGRSGRRLLALLESARPEDKPAILRFKPTLRTFHAAMTAMTVAVIALATFRP